MAGHCSQSAIQRHMLHHHPDIDVPSNHAPSGHGGALYRRLTRPPVVNNKVFASHSCTDRGRCKTTHSSLPAIRYGAAAARAGRPDTTGCLAAGRVDGRGGRTRRAPPGPTRRRPAGVVTLPRPKAAGPSDTAGAARPQSQMDEAPGESVPLPPTPAGREPVSAPPAATPRRPSGPSGRPPVAAAAIVAGRRAALTMAARLCSGRRGKARPTGPRQHTHPSADPVRTVTVRLTTRRGAAAAAPFAAHLSRDSVTGGGARPPLASRAEPSAAVPSLSGRAIRPRKEARRPEWCRAGSQRAGNGRVPDGVQTRHGAAHGDGWHAHSQTRPL